MPRGGGRSGTLFGLPFQGNQQIQSLSAGEIRGWEYARETWASDRVDSGRTCSDKLPGGLNSANNANQVRTELAQRQKQISDQKAAGLAAAYSAFLYPTFRRWCDAGTSVGVG